MLNIGYASTQILPDRPAMLQGQMHVRVAKTTLDPLLAVAVALEGTRPGGGRDCAIIVSLDVAFITEALQTGVRAAVAAQLPDVPAEKIYLTATHTHTSMVFLDGIYTTPEGVMTPQECLAFLVGKAAQVVVAAWQARAPSKIARGFGHAVVAHNRRTVFANGDAEMYGRASRKDFRWIEGPEDHTVDMFFVWNAAGKLAGVMVNVPCPAQVVEGLSEFCADFWHEVRGEFASRFGAGVWVLPMCGASGDQSPHFIFDNKQEAEMRARRGVSERQEIALRIADAVQRALACTAPTDDDTLAHDVKRIDLPPRTIQRKERDWSEAERAKVITRMDPKSWWPERLRGVVETFDGVRKAGRVPVELHAIRLGDAVIVTNPFELFTDYGLQIKARSAAAQTFVCQLVAGVGFYLPTERGVQGGGYGANAAVSIVGPDGGQELVEHTLSAIAALFPAQAPAAAK